MLSGRHLLVILLLLPILAQFPFASSSSQFQVVTSYSASYSPVSTLTSTSTASQTIVSDSFPVPSASYGCNIMYDKFNGQSGIVSINMTSDNPVDFYLVTMSSFNAWLSPGGNLISCYGPLPALAATSYPSRSYQTTAKLPANGEYRAVFVNHSKTLTANIAISISGPENVTYVTTSYSLVQQASLATKSTLAQLRQSTSTLPRLNQTGLLPVFGVIVIVVIANLTISLVGIALMKREKKTGPTGATTRSVATSSATMFRRKCGTKRSNSIHRSSE